MRRLSSLLLLCLIGLLPVSAFAAVPSITGIKAALVDGHVHVSWSLPVNANAVESYNVYWSNESILLNDGQYDDFESAGRNVTEHTIESQLAGERVYVSVLAIDSEGNEGNFTQEVAVDLPRGTLPATIIGTTGMTAGKLALLSAQPISATEVLLTFNAPVLLPSDSKQAAKAFTIKAANGTPLAIQRLVVKGREVTLTTARQRLGIRYTVTVGSVVKVLDDPSVQLDPTRSSVSFTTEGSTSSRGGIVTVPGGGKLPSSGLPIVAVIALAGGVMGSRMMRKKKS